MTQRNFSAPIALAKRVGSFVVGAFAGVCAAFVPRLFMMIAPQTGSGSGTLVVFTKGYVVASIAFAVLIGGAVLVFEWDGRRSPRDTFMSALAIPALLTGSFNSVVVATEVTRQAERTEAISTRRAEDAGVAIDDNPVGVDISSNWLPAVLPVALANDGPLQANSQKSQPLELGVRYRERDYWISLAKRSSRKAAEDRADDLGSEYGSLEVKELNETFHVTLEGGPFPYSEAVDRAIRIKEQSNKELTPELLRAR